MLPSSIILIPDYFYVHAFSPLFEPNLDVLAYFSRESTSLPSPPVVPPISSRARHLLVAENYGDSAHNISWRLKMTKSNSAERSLAGSSPCITRRKHIEKPPPPPSPLR